VSRVRYKGKALLTDTKRYGMQKNPTQEKIMQENRTEDLLELPQNPTLGDFQNYVVKLKKMRGFRDDKKNALIFLFNEVGELGQAIAKTWGNEETLSDEARKNISFEMADIFIFLLDLANQYGLSLEEAFRKKEEVNKRRTWSAHHRG
jgi:NTP pyrophosphatase (non-canonical NTP hydrolase)